LEDVDGQCVEEFVSDNKWRLVRFARDKAHIFCPDNLEAVIVLALTLESDFVLGERVVTAEQAMLR
jgi:hypothetical protein